MRILFLSPRQCWPAQSGAKLREYHFLRSLAAQAEVTYIHFTDPALAPLGQRDLPFCRDVVAVPKPKPYGAGQMVRGLFGPWPLPILNYTSAAMHQAVARAHRAGRFDLVHLDSIHMIRYGDPREKLFYNWHNIESEAMRRYSETVSSLPRRWYGQRTAVMLRTLEKRILIEAAGHVVCSEREREALRKITPAARIAVIENGVDTAFFSRAEPHTAKTGPGHAMRLVFVGSMDYFPNAEAAISFARGTWPEVRKRFPDAELAIVGANPGADVRALGELPGVTVTGTVPDVRPWYHDAFAAIVPLRTGGGTRLKILEAMAAGVPVISTPLGAEGLAVTADCDILLAGPDDSGAWVEHLSRLVSQPGLRAQLTESALRLVRTRYDWEMIGRKLSDTYTRWLSEPA